MGKKCIIIFTIYHILNIFASSIGCLISIVFHQPGKFKAHELRLKSKGDLVKTLEELKEELAKVNIFTLHRASLYLQPNE